MKKKALRRDEKNFYKEVRITRRKYKNVHNQHHLRFGNNRRVTLNKASDLIKEA